MSLQARRHILFLHRVAASTSATRLVQHPHILRAINPDLSSDACDHCKSSCVSYIAHGASSDMRLGPTCATPPATKSAVATGAPEVTLSHFHCGPLTGPLAVSSASDVSCPMRCIASSSCAAVSRFAASRCRQAWIVVRARLLRHRSLCFRFSHGYCSLPFARSSTCCTAVYMSGINTQQWQHN